MRAGKPSRDRVHASSRNDSFLALVLELRPSVRLSGFVERFTQRVAEMLRARAAALALARGAQMETVFLHDPAAAPDNSVLPRLNAALTALAGKQSQWIRVGPAARLLGQSLAHSLGWNCLAVARLTDSVGNPIGLLCLADLAADISASDRNLLLALVGHASVTLENSRLLSRIEQSKKQWVEIFDAIPDFIVVHDQSHRVLRVNRSLADFLGLSPAALIGRKMRGLISVAAAGGSRLCPFCGTGKETAEEHLHPANERTYLVSTSRIRGGFEEGVRTIHVLKDITDRREAERRYRELFDNIQEGLFFSTPEGRFLEVNDALVRMLGYASREELLQADLTRLNPVSAEHRRRSLEALERDGVLRNYEEVLRRKDGSSIHTLQDLFAVRDRRGRVVQHRGLMLDVTEQKSFQAQLQRERDFNRKILDNTQNMILVLDDQGRVGYANRRCFEAGYREQDLLGRPLVEFVPPAHRPALAEALETTLRGLSTDKLELPLRACDGRTGHFSVHLSPMRDEQGQVSSIVAVLTDLTDAALLHARLMHTEKMAAVGQLVSGVAHEINNPLAAILGFADLLLADPVVVEAAKDELRLILQEAERAKEIVRNLLSFARQMPAQREPLQLNSILRQTLQLRAYDFSSHGVEVVERIEEELPEIVGDPRQLQQVFLNILNNAYDAVREASDRARIEIETSRRDGFAEVLFRDNGPGIAHPDRIFEPFFTTKEVGKGTGLGLSICYGIVRAHGGEVICYNTAGRQGATFVVRLPLAACLAAAEAER